MFATASLLLLLLFHSFQSRIEANRGAHRRRNEHEVLSTVVVAEQARTTIAPAVCSSPQEFQFSQIVSLTFQGHAGELKDTDVDFLQEAMIRAYNEAADACNSIPGGYLKLAQVKMSLSSALNTSGIARNFTIIATAVGAYRGWNESPFRLFQKGSSPAERSALVGFHLDKAAPKPPSSVFDGCICPVPSISLFMLTFNSAIKQMMSLSLIMVEIVEDPVKEARSLAVCSYPAEQKFQTFIYIAFIGGSQRLFKFTTLRSQYQLLQNAVLYTYNKFNTGNLCQNFIINITDVQIVVKPGSDGYGYTSLNRRLLNQNITDLRNAYVFNITGKCRGSQGIPKLFYNDTAKRRRVASVIRADDYIFSEQRSKGPVLQVETGDFDTESLPSSFQDQGPRRLLATACPCPTSTTKFSLPRKVDFLTALNRRLKTLEDSKSVNIVANATVVFQTVPVNCSANVKYFYNDVEISVAVTKNINITSEAAVELSEAFWISYNAQAQLYCDTLFRTVDAVQFVGAQRVNQKADIQTRSRGSGSTMVKFIFKVRGRCRNCPSTTKLFNDAAAGNRYLSISSTVATDDDYVFAQANALQDRHLVSETADCFCATNSLGDGTPSQSKVADRIAKSFARIKALTAGFNF